jgi:LuxR family quorum sensing-dependent transcriptional regulator
MTVLRSPLHAVNIAKREPMDCEVFTFIEGLEWLSNEDEAVAALQRILATFDIRYFMFFRDWPTMTQFEELVFCRRMPEQWFEIYVKEKYSGVDPAFWPSRRSSWPFVWLEAPIDAAERPRTVAFVRRAADFGLAQGLIVPIPGTLGRQGVAWLGGANPELTPRTMSALHLVALYAFERVRRFHAPPRQKKPPLTRREREVLAWVAQGKSAWEIGEILSIAKRTVDEHTQTATRKLGAINRTQAVVNAIQIGEIKFSKANIITDW